MMMPKIRLDIELDVAKALFDMIHKKVNRKERPEDPVGRMELAMLGVELADKIHKHQIVSRMNGLKREPDPRD
jgi:hypothetical protein